MENPEISGRIQVERFIPVEFFRKKSNIFRGITFFPFLTKRAKFSVPFVWITSPRLHVERKWKIYRYFVNGTTRSCSCFRCQILTNQINNQSIIPSTDVIQLTLTLKMTTAQVLKTSVSVNLTTVLFRTTVTRTFNLNLLLKWLLGSNLSQVTFNSLYLY